jgi:hypothetical protein
MRKIVISLLTPCLFGILSGVAVYLTFRIVPMIPGIIFALFSGAYFNLRIKVPIHDLILWVAFSFSSFLVSAFIDIVTAFSEPLINEAYRTGMSSFAGALVLVFGFHVLFFRIKPRELFFIFVFATIIPTIFSSYVSYKGDNSDVTFWLPLFTIWQTFTMLFFAYIINTRLSLGMEPRTSNPKISPFEKKAF